LETFTRDMARTTAASPGVPDLPELIYEPEFVEELGAAAPERQVGPAATEGSGMLQPPPTVGELKMRAARVEFEAGRNLEMLSRKYDLTEEQQALAFPILARASQAYHPAIAIEGEAATDAFLSATIAAPEIESDLEEAPPQAAAPSTLDDVEAKLAPLLNDKQRAQIKEEALDRYYWWGEILLQIAADIDAESVPAVAEADPGEVEQDPGEPEPGPAPPPAAHQGANLFDLL
jgi:hypothetical protein